ncbi:MAG TPA: PKD domain-containing protein [Methanothrix sp.]|nr:PKD domain-containing protein [Methanothrix sp.]
MASEAVNLSLNGTCFQDLDANGFRSIDEPGLEGWTIRLALDGKEIANTSTDNQGGYIFRNLAPGNYELKEEPASGWQQTAPGGGSYPIRLTDKPAYNLDFGDINESKGVAARSAREYPIMHPTPEEVRNWTELYMQAPKAHLSPQIASMLTSAPGESYSLLNLLDYIPSERDQGSCGNCWAWAGTGVMEIDLANQTGIKDRLSIQYLDSNYHGGCGYSGACCGGWLQYLAYFYSGTRKAIPWSNANAQYLDGSAGCGGCTRVSASSISTNPNYPLTSIEATTIPTQSVSKDVAIQNIKNVLRQGKAIWFGYFLPTSSSWSDFEDFWSTRSESTVWQADAYCGQQYTSGGGGHAVLCVGYNDTDPNNSYWIMLNSWGDTTLRPHGLFRVNMDMNYGGSYGHFGSAFYWMTLEIGYPHHENMPPETPPAPDGPSKGYTNHTICFTAATYDPDMDRVKYTFDWGDGNRSETDFFSSYVCASASHSWKSQGIYNVTVMATDVKGASSNWSMPSSINITRPIRPPETPTTLAGPRFGYARSNYSYSTSSMDPDGDDVKFTFQWGDASTSETAYVPSGTRATASHSWAIPGNYSIQAMATDIQGISSGWSTPLNVSIVSNNPPGKPSRPAGPAYGYSGVSYSYNTTARDSDGDAVKYTFDWRDGSQSETGYIPSGSEGIASHIWSCAGSYRLRARATDIKGATSAWSDELEVNITTNHPPNTPSAPSGPTTGHVRSSYTYSASTSDPDGDNVKYTFDWGDKTQNETDFVKSGIAVNASHTWQKAGTYYVKVKAADGKVESAWSPTLTVRISGTPNAAPIRPSTPAGTTRGTAGKTYTYTSFTTDPNGDNVKYTFDWGDGTRSETGYTTSGKSVRLSHAWSIAGTYRIMVMATDTDGAVSSGSAPLTVRIS